MVEPTLKHPGTGRPCIVLPASNLATAEPYKPKRGKYVLFIATVQPSPELTVEQARAWLNSGASYVCAWGPSASEVEETFDYASFLPKLGAPLSYTLLTTSHNDEPLGEALWFAFWNSAPPDDLHLNLDLVVVQPESEALALQVRTWVQSNRE
jgi:hypothetical protein